MEPLELGIECEEAELTARGFRRTKRLGGDRFPKGTFRHESGNEIYIVHEPDAGGKVRPLMYINLETGDYQEKIENE